MGFPDGAFVQAVNLTAPDGSHRKVAGMPKSAATAWRVIGPSAGGRGHPEKWRYFDHLGDEFLDIQFRVRENADYDPRTRAWFLESQASGKTVVSKVYVFSSLKKPGVTVSEQVHNLPDISVGVDLSLSDLAGRTAALRPGKGGVVAVIDGNGDVVAHPEPKKTVKLTANKDAIELVAATNIDDPLVRTAIRDSNASQQSHRSFNLSGKDYISYFRPAAKGSIVNWNIVSVAVMAGWITRPVVRLRRMADQITHLNFSEVEDFKTPFEEINRLQISMGHMKGALDTFLRFVPRDVVRELVQAGQAATIGGTKREVTLLFTDVEGFTTMTERMTPEEIMSQASEYFENLSFGIQSNRGTIDKFIGDAIMAIWNAPTEDAMHADNACRGALAAYHISEDLNGEFAAKSQSIMRTRFSLHTGDVLVGNVGARDRMQYTCLGSSVNLAARIEGLN